MAEHANGSLKSRSNQFLLVVDSNPGELFYTAMLLQRFEYTIYTAKTAKEALEIMSVAMPVLLVAGYDLIDRNAVDLLGHLRKQPSTSGLPVIVLLPAGAHDQGRSCREAGAAACLPKPVQAEEMYRSVQEAIEPTPRKNIRIPTVLQVSVNGTPLDCVEGECASVLSEHGIYIRTLRPSPVKAAITIQLTLSGKTISADAVVLYSYRFGEGPFKEPGMGLKFTRIASHDQELLRQFINAEITKGIKPM